VQDLSQTVAWYQRHLGYEVISRADNETRSGVLLQRPGSLLELAAFADAAARHPGLESHQVYGVFKLGFSTPDLDQMFTKLQAADVTLFFPIVTTPEGHRTFGVKDPEGNIIQFFESIETGDDQ